MSAADAVYGDGSQSFGRGEKRRRSAGMGRAERRRIARRAARRRKRSFLREMPVIAVVALLIALLLKTFLMQVFVIPSGSMEDTIKIGDRVVVDKFSPWFGEQYKRGDVVVFKDPGGWLSGEDQKTTKDGPVIHAVKQVFIFIGLLPSDNEGDLIKRVIGVGGDTVACCDKNGKVTVNGTPVDETYVAPGNPPSRQSFKITVPRGRLWVMGDHRDVSADSRFHMSDIGNGTIPLDDVIGRAVVVAWPMSRMHDLPEPHALSSLPPPPGSLVSAAGRTDGRENLGQPGAWDGLGPIPGEPSLVMGVAAALPPAVLRWWRRRRLARRG